MNRNVWKGILFLWSMNKNSLCCHDTLISLYREEAMKSFYTSSIKKLWRLHQNKHREFLNWQGRMSIKETVQVLFRNQGMYNGLIVIWLLYAWFVAGSLTFSRLFLIYIYMCALFIVALISQKLILFKRVL